jgi:hypothetical protein
MVWVIPAFADAELSGGISVSAGTTTVANDFPRRVFYRIQEETECRFTYYSQCRISHTPAYIKQFHCCEQLRDDYNVFCDGVTPCYIERGGWNARSGAGLLYGLIRDTFIGSRFNVFAHIISTESAISKVSVERLINIPIINIPFNIQGRTFTNISVRNRVYERVSNVDCLKWLKSYRCDPSTIGINNGGFIIAQSKVGNECQNDCYARENLGGVGESFSYYLKYATGYSAIAVTAAIMYFAFYFPIPITVLIWLGSLWMMGCVLGWVGM